MYRIPDPCSVSVLFFFQNVKKNFICKINFYIRKKKKKFFLVYGWNHKIGDEKQRRVIGCKERLIRVNSVSLVALLWWGVPGCLLDTNEKKRNVSQRNTKWLPPKIRGSLCNRRQEWRPGNLSLRPLVTPKERKPFVIFSKVVGVVIWGEKVLVCPRYFGEDPLRTRSQVLPSSTNFIRVLWKTATKQN